MFLEPHVVRQCQCNLETWEFLLMIKELLKILYLSITSIPIIQIHNRLSVIGNHFDQSSFIIDDRETLTIIKL